MLVQGNFYLGDRTVKRFYLPILLIALAANASSLLAQTPPLTPDIPPKFDKPTAVRHEEREVMIPMRDGVELYTVSHHTQRRPKYADPA